MPHTTRIRSGVVALFARALFYINACKQSADPREVVASVFSVMRNVSVTRGIGTKEQPNISSTIWRTVSNHKNRVYYFEDTASPSLLWVKLNKVDFKDGSGVRKLTHAGKPDVGGTKRPTSRRPSRSSS